MAPDLEDLPILLESEYVQVEEDEKSNREEKKESKDEVLGERPNSKDDFDVSIRTILSSPLIAELPSNTK